MREENLIFFRSSDKCPVRHVLSRFGDKWSILILLTLDTNGTMRFSEMHRTVGDISQRMLTVTLRTLEADGLVSREVYPEVPPRVEYTVTEMGRSLMPHIRGLLEWSADHMPEIVDRRKQAAVL